MWVADWEDDKLYAYDLEGKTHVSGQGLQWAQGRRATTDPGGHLVRREPPCGWPTGKTTKLYAYLTGSRAWNPGQDFNTLVAAGNRDPSGIWSDGDHHVGGGQRMTTSSTPTTWPARPAFRARISTPLDDAKNNDPRWNLVRRRHHVGGGHCTTTRSTLTT